MTVVLIVLAAIVVIVIVVGLALSPVLNKKGDVAIGRAKELLGSEPIVIEPKAVGMGTEPPEAGGLLGLGCLAMNATKIAFVTWQPAAEWTLDRSKITGVEVAAEDPSAVQKTTIEVHFKDGDDDVVAKWRFGRDLVDWLNELGYDWGPDGPPSSEPADSSDSSDASDASDS